MKIRKVLCIINPASGMDFPVLAVVNRFFTQHHIQADYFVTQKANDGEFFARSALERDVDAVVVYGGDGTIMEAGHALANTDLPLVILPGGTANVIAKEFGISLDIEQALRQLVLPESKVIAIDTYKTNNKSYMLRVNLGLFADVVRLTPRSQKNAWGQLAYLWEGAKQLQATTPLRYVLQYDDKPPLEVEGIGLTITNLASIGMLNWMYHPDVDPSDGKLDILLLPPTDLISMAGMATESAFQQFTTALQHYQANQVRIQLPTPQSIMLDEEVITTDHCELHIQPASLNIIVPKESQ